MTAPPSIDLSGWLSEQLAAGESGSAPADDDHVRAGVDGCRGRRGLRRRVRRPSRASGRTPATATGAGTGTPGPARSSWRSRSCVRVATSRTGCSSGAAAPRRRWCRWSPRAICSGSATRRMEKLVETLGITRLSKSQVSGDGQGPRRAGRGVPHPPAGRRPVHVRRRRRAGAQGPRGRPHVNVHALLATGVNADGYKEILGLHVTSAEDGFRLRAPGAGTSRKRSLVTDLADDLPKPDWSSTRLLSTHVKTG